MRWVNILHAYQPPNWDPAIVDRVTKECYRPLSEFLLATPQVRVTLNLAGSLVVQLTQQGHADVLKNLHTVVKRGQVELMMMPMYHPIIPFLTVEEAERQVAANRTALKKVFGSDYQPVGFFPPELAVNDATGQLASQLGFRWLVMDEVAFGRGFAEVDVSRHYRWKGTNLHCLFRSRTVSDYLAFTLDRTPTDGLEPMARSLGYKGDTLITAMDAENLGHHRPAAAPAWRALVTAPGVETMTASDYLQLAAPSEEVTPLPSSWSSDDHDLQRGVPYPLWDNPENPVHQALRALFRQAQTTLATNAHAMGFAEARERLDRAQASDLFWWASMRPWWDAGIVLREAEELFHALDPLALQPNPLTDLWSTARTSISEWETKGLAKQARDTYIENHRPTTFFAGHHIT